MNVCLSRPIYLESTEECAVHGTLYMQQVPSYCIELKSAASGDNAQFKVFENQRNKEIYTKT